MKKNKSFKAFIAMLAIGVISGCIARADDVTTTNSGPSLTQGFQEIYDAATSATNYGLAFGAARGTTGQRNLAFADLAYNFNQNVGLIIGYDYLWAAKKFGQADSANLVKGGISLQVGLQPLKNFGLTNFTVTPFAFALVATGNGNVSEILGGGVKTRLWTWKGFDLDTGVLYEDRTGAGFWNGRYLGGFLAVTKGF